MNKRVCLLTGASGRLGSALCNRLSESYSVAAVYWRRLPKNSSQASRLISADSEDRVSAESPEVFAIKADLESPQSYERIVDLTLARFGGVDVLIHAAGYGFWGNLLTSDQVHAQTDSQFRINTLAPLQLSLALMHASWRDQPEANRMHNRNIICISSMASAKVYSGRGQSIYGASKVALNMLVLHMASEFAICSVRVNALLPDSFPSVIPTESVIEAALELDRSRSSGLLVPIEKSDCA